MKKTIGARIKWIDRKFSFDFPMEYFPEIMERLRSTPARIEDLIKDIANVIFQELIRFSSDY